MHEETSSYEVLNHSLQICNIVRSISCSRRPVCFPLLVNALFLSPQCSNLVLKQLGADVAYFLGTNSPPVCVIGRNCDIYEERPGTALADISLI
ncbi:hypothetical protein PanWU01x14_196460 [Parasponia andersonii]|uniref:Uncharacterized protein n=1 Tax=Parasponia andersonii TaxID=3476 RepID=A0A2P5BZR6_PARAD|nr:hypothetical protein PanWU01x14_196460 [Parasponia andersonii]